VEPKSIWKDKQNRRFTSFVVSKKQLLATGHPDAKPEQAFLAAINIADGSDAWLKVLPANVVKGGTAVDHTGRIFITLENGRLLCFALSIAK
jgi:outer membrane protein assembly factor BamB